MGFGVWDMQYPPAGDVAAGIEVRCANRSRHATRPAMRRGCLRLHRRSTDRFIASCRRWKIRCRAWRAGTCRPSPESRPNGDTGPRPRSRATPCPQRSRATGTAGVVHMIAAAAAAVVVGEARGRVRARERLGRCLACCGSRSARSHPASCQRGRGLR